MFVKINHFLQKLQYFAKITDPLYFIIISSQIHPNIHPEKNSSIMHVFFVFLNFDPKNKNISPQNDRMLTIFICS